jgi:hypothetical protein
LATPIEMPQAGSCFTYDVHYFSEEFTHSVVVESSLLSVIHQFLNAYPILVHPKNLGSFLILFMSKFILCTLS